MGSEALQREEAGSSLKPELKALQWTVPHSGTALIDAGGDVVGWLAPSKAASGEATG